MTAYFTEANLKIVLCVPNGTNQDSGYKTFLREHSIIYLLAQGLSEVMELKKFHVYCKVMEEKLVK